MTNPGKEGAMKAVIYAAKSTEDKHNSIRTQITDGRGLAEREGYEVVADYKDEAKSAYHGSRGDGLAQAKAHAESIAPCALIVQHTDRLARGDGVKGDHLVEVVMWARRAGVTIRSVQDDATCASMGFAGMMGDRNHEDSKRKGESVESGLRRRVVERRQPLAARDRPGRGRRHPAHLRRNPGRGGAAEHRYRPERGPGADADGGRRYATTVAGMLRNPLYIGQITHRGEHYPGDHEPIIDQETWDQVQALREARKGRPRGRRTAGQHVLTEGLLRCPTCGAAISPVTKRDKRAANGRGYETYACVERLHHGVKACSQKPIRRGAIDGAIYDYFEANELDADATRDLLVKQVEQALASEGNLREQAERELAKAEAAHERIEGDDIAGKLSADDSAHLRERLGGELRGGTGAGGAAPSAAGRGGGNRRRPSTLRPVIAQELTTLRQRIVGEAREGHDDLDRFRVLLRRLFDSFDLATNGDGYLLLPQMRVSRMTDGRRWDFEAFGGAARLQRQLVLPLPHPQIPTDAVRADPDWRREIKRATVQPFLLLRSRGSAVGRALELEPGPDAVLHERAGEARRQRVRRPPARAVGGH